MLAVRAPVLLGRLDADRVEALLDRAAALVRGEDPLALGDERLGGLMQLVLAHRYAFSLSVCRFPDYSGR